jgi:hypothetical protein
MEKSSTAFWGEQLEIHSKVQIIPMNYDQDDLKSFHDEIDQVVDALTFYEISRSNASGKTLGKNCLI